MKKVLSIILLISMLMSMMLIPAAADEPYVYPEATDDAYRNNVMRGPTDNGAPITSSRVGFSGLQQSGYVVDGYRPFHKPDNSGSLQYILDTSSNTPQYDINNKVVDGGKYVATLTFEFSKDYTSPLVDMIRIYLEWINIGSDKCSPYMVNGFDLALSETAEDGSWTVVYSETNIANEGKYLSHYDPVNKRETAYVEVKLDQPIKANYLRFAVTDRDHDLPNCKNNNHRKRIQMAEVEVWAPKLDTTYRTNAALGATMPAAPLGYPASGDIAIGGSEKLTDGIVSCYNADGTGDSIGTFGLSNKEHLKARMDIDGNSTANNKYSVHFTYQLKNISTLECIRLFVGKYENNKPDQWLPNAMDIAVSETGEPGSWKIVYSDNKIVDNTKYQIYKDENGKFTTYVEGWFEPTEAKYIRIAISDTTKQYMNLSELQAWTVEDIPEPEEPDVEEPKETGVNSLMLFPLLMRHRQYETETTTTMFGLRVKHLLRSADAITFEKNGVKVDIPAATLKALNLAGSDKLVVTITGTDAENAKVTVTVNGKAVDIEGIASSTPEDEEPEVKGTTYRWDFNDLNEANGLNNLTDSAKSTKSYTFEDGMIKIADRTTDFELAEAINLTPWADWSIEWRSQLEANSALFGSENSEQNFVYLAYAVSSFKYSFRMVDANNQKLQISYGDYANLNVEEMRTWKVEFSAEDNRLTLMTFDEEAKDWVEIGAGTPPSFNFELTHMFGRNSSADVCLKGQVDYIEVFVGE